MDSPFTATDQGESICSLKTHVGFDVFVVMLSEYRESTQVLVIHHIGSGGCEWSSYNKVLPPVDGKDAKTHCFPFPPSLE